MSMATPANMLITSLFAISLPLYTVYHAVSRCPFSWISLDVMILVIGYEQDEADFGRGECFLGVLMGIPGGGISTSLINYDV
jgi:hypothetical protein